LLVLATDGGKLAFGRHGCMVKTIMETVPDRSKPSLLRGALLANAVFSLTTGAGLLLFAGRLAPLIGADVPPLLLAAIGAALLPFGGFTAWLGRRRNPDPVIALAVSLADLGWVAGSALLLALAHRSLSATGVALVLAVAVMVLAFALGQLRGIMRAYAAGPGDGARFRVCFDLRSDGDAGTIWRNLARLGEIARFAPSLAASGLRDDANPGAGAIRECTDRAGRRWSERCTALDHERRELAVEFLTREPGFPFPFAEMTGGWSVRAEPDGALVRLWWEGRPQYPALSPVILPLLAWQARRQFPVMVGLMAGQRVAVAGGSPLPVVVPC
jgi:hypothetical protein